MSESVGSVEQILVIPGRVEPLGDEFAGMAMPNSPISGATYKRATLAAQFALENDVERIICVGGLPRNATEAQCAAGTPAEAIARILLGADVEKDRIIVHNAGRTMRGYFEAALESVNDRRTLGIVAHGGKQWERAKHCGRLALPDTALYAILTY